SRKRPVTGRPRVRELQAHHPPSRRIGLVALQHHKRSSYGSDLGVFQDEQTAFSVRAVSVTLHAPTRSRGATMETEMETTVLESTKLSGHIGHALAIVVEQFATWLLTSGARIVIVLVLAWIALRLLRSATTRLDKALVGTVVSLERTKRADTILGMVRTTASILIGIAAGMMVLRETGIDVAPVLATAGIGGLAIGFGAQTLVKDVISGFFLLVEDQVRIGDVVEVAGRRGTVETIQLRTIQLRDLSGNLHVVPNGSITLV